jgi:polyribonucleotide nucleotidyltransferase
MALLQDKLIENENNNSNTELIRNHIFAIAENNGVRVEIQDDNQIFWYGDDEAVAETKQETVASLKELHPELF